MLRAIFGCFGFENGKGVLRKIEQNPAAKGVTENNNRNVKINERLKLEKQERGLDSMR